MLESVEEGKKDHIIGEDTIIETNVKINGLVRIGDNCHISSGSSIGPNVSIGDNSVISVSSIENSIIMQNCKIDTVTEIKNSIIANNSEIKGSATNNEKIFLLGEGSKISLWDKVRVWIKNLLSA